MGEGQFSSRSGFYPGCGRLGDGDQSDAIIVVGLSKINNVGLYNPGTWHPYMSYICQQRYVNKCVHLDEKKTQHLYVFLYSFVGFLCC